MSKMAKQCSPPTIFWLLFFHFLACVAMSSKNIATDEFGLLAFKSSIKDPNLMLKNWSASSSYSLCNWAGVTCDLRHRRVKALDLSNMGLLGVIPSHVGNLSFLKKLDLQGNNFHGELPPELSQLHRMRSLNLSFNMLDGFIPPSISNLSKLEYFDLSSNFIKGVIPTVIGQLRQLKVLNFTSNSFSGTIPPTISNLSSLQAIFLSQNTLSGEIPRQMEDLVQLRTMNFNDNRLSGEIPISLWNISSLEELGLAKNKLKGSLPHEICHQSPHLEVLSVDENQFEGSIPRSMGNCTWLQWLGLGGNLLTGPIPIEIGNLDQLEIVALGYNKLSGHIPSKIFNISTLRYLYLGSNSLSGILPSNMGYNLPKLQQLHLYENRFVGNIPNSLSNASMLIVIDMSENEFNGILPNTLGNLSFLQALFIQGRNLTLEPNFLTSLTSCRHLMHLQVRCFTQVPGAGLPKSIGNLSESLKYFWLDFCGIVGNIPPEIGNITNLLDLSMGANYDISGPMPATFKRLQNLQTMNLEYNGLQGSIDVLCEMSLSELVLEYNMISGAIPTCLGNMTSLRKLHMKFNRLTSEIPSSFWNLRDILEVDLSSNALVGNLSGEIGSLRALLALDLSRNQISGNIPAEISFLKTLQNLSLASNKLQGSIPASLDEMISLSFLDLSQNLLSGVIPDSLESLTTLKFINLSYNTLQGEIPSGGPFVNFTAQSFTHNKALCGNPRLQVLPCPKQVGRRRSRRKLVLFICMPIVVSIILLITYILVRLRKRKIVQNALERNSSGLGAPKRVSYYELVQATNGFSESNLLGKGSFGSVYQGMLSSGLMVAVKVFDLNLEATSKSFDAECNAMRNLRHRNLVKIISSCSNVDFKSLVMEFMSNGNLDKWLYSDDYCLDFFQRLSIMTDVASAIEYLHYGSSMPVIHCDLKPSNVLLDEDMVAHVSDFGIAKLLDEGQSKTHTETMATLGYVAPEYGSKGFVSIKGDVYSYGIMVMEVFTRKRPTDDMFAEGLSLKSWIDESISNSIIEVVDSNLVQLHGEQIDNILPQISSILKLALGCCADSPEERIKITDVVASLTKIKASFTQKK